MGQAEFEMIDSVLSEAAVLGFEYGYATSEPNALVDLGSAVRRLRQRRAGRDRPVHRRRARSSGAASAGSRCCCRTATKGQGPEHSSARPERYLQLCAEHNMQVCVPTTPAQIFHLLRRQMVRDFRKPLIVMSPKSLLRHKAAVSTLEELADGKFQTVIGEVDKLVAEERAPRDRLQRQGLLRSRRPTGASSKIADIAVIRLEQQYPFPHADFKAADRRAYPNAEEVVWCQEEPQNQGAWYRLRAYLRADIADEQVLAYAGRPISASPAVGYMSKHLAQQKQLVEDAFAAKLDSGEIGDG